MLYRLTLILLRGMDCTIVSTITVCRSRDSTGKGALLCIFSRQVFLMKLWDAE